MKLSTNDLVYFIGTRELEKEQYKIQLQKLTTGIEQLQQQIEKLQKEKLELTEKKLGV